MIDDAVLLLGAHPAGVEVDRGIALDGVIAEEVEAQEDRHRASRVGRAIEEDIHARAVIVSGETHANLASQSAATKGLALFGDKEPSSG